MQHGVDWRETSSLSERFPLFFVCGIKPAQFCLFRPVGKEASVSFIGRLR